MRIRNELYHCSFYNYFLLLSFLQAEPVGTFWYHSHVGSQRSNGVFGAFIVKERYPPGTKLPTDMIMAVGDWHHENSDEVRVTTVTKGKKKDQDYIYPIVCKMLHTDPDKL